MCDTDLTVLLAPPTQRLQWRVTDPDPDATVIRTRATGWVRTQRCGGRQFEGGGWPGPVPNCALLQQCSRLRGGTGQI